MNETVLISLPIKALETLIIDCVNACLIANGKVQDTTNSDQLLTIKETATLLSLSVPTIYGLVSRSEIPVSKQGKRLYFSKQELLDWIRKGRKKTNAEISAEAVNYVSKRNRR